LARSANPTSIQSRPYLETGPILPEAGEKGAGDRDVGKRLESSLNYLSAKLYPLSA